MRAGLAGLALVVVLAAPVTASAATVGTATTSTGQTLTVSIDTPADGETEYGSSAANMSGHVGLSAAPDGGTPTSVQSIAVGTGDAYEADGSTYAGNAQYSGFDTWTSYNQIAYEGTRTIYATAIAADGTRATANITITVDPKQLYTVTAFAVLYDWRLGGVTGTLTASMVDRMPMFGTPIDFYVRGEHVCSASIAAATGSHAVCSDPVAVAKAVNAGGYEARYAGSAWAHPSSGSAGLVNQR